MRMKRIGNLEIKLDEDTFQPHLHVTVAIPMQIATDFKEQTDPQKFYDEFVELLKVKIKEEN